MKTKEKITGELLKAIKHIDISNDPKDVREFHKSGKYHEITTNFVNDGIVIAYKQEALQHIEEALNHVFDFRKDLSEIVSEEFVMRKLKEIIKNALLNEDPNKNNLIISDVKMLLRNIRNKDNYIIFTRVFNLKCSNIYDFGNVRLYPNKTVFMEELGDKCPSAVKDFLEKYFEKNDFEKSASGKEFCIAEVYLSSAEEINAKERAFYDLDHFLNILRVCDGRNPIWIEGENIRMHRFYFSYNRNKEKLSGKFESLDAKINPFDLDKLYRLYPQPMNRIESVLKKENRTSMESRIVNSLTWLGESVKEKDDAHKLLKMIIALECLLLEKEANKKYLLAERCAFLLSNRFEDIIKIKELIEDVYELRNDVVHEGKRLNIRKKVLKDLFMRIRKLNIKFLMSNEFKSMKDVQEFVERCKYGSEKEKIKSHPSG